MSEGKSADARGKARQNFLRALQRDKALWGFVAVVVAAFSAFAIARYHTFHNQTFDLAFYTRMAWGFVRLDLWMPLTEAHFFGLHLSPILIPIGVIGTLLDDLGIGSIQSSLLIAQSASAGFAALCLASLAAGSSPAGTEAKLNNRARRLLFVGAFTLLFHPNLLHVLSYEAHPGTLALGPIAALLRELDLARHSPECTSLRRVFVFSILVLSCREDLALQLIIVGLLFWRTPLRKTGVLIAIASLLYFAFFLFVLHPRYAPEASSFHLHFGHFGNTPSAVLSSWFRDPITLLSHLFQAQNLRYLGLLFLISPLALFRPRLLLVAAPILAINLLSRFPTTANLDSHYLTLAVPSFVAANLVSYRVLETRFPNHEKSLTAVTLVLSAALFVTFGIPKVSAFLTDDRTAAAEAVLDMLPVDASVSAPDELLPHLATRARFFRQVTEPGVPNRGSDFVVLNGSHRERFRHDEDLLRTLQEPVLRRWLAREDYGLVATEAPYFVFERGADGRAGRIAGHTAARTGVELTRCLLWNSARQEGTSVVLRFIAREPCAEDLALRFEDSDASGKRRVDLLFSGELSPAALLPGDIVESRHADCELPVSIGLLRSSGARPEPQDPTAISSDALTGE